MELLSFYGNMLGQLFNFQLPFWGITFGAMIVGIFGAPILVNCLKKLF